VLGSGLAATALPVEAPLFRTLEKPRGKEKKPHQLPRHLYERHPWPEKEPALLESIPGDVEKPLEKEEIIRDRLRHKKKVTDESWEDLITVFSNRARNEIKWMPVQRRHFLQRAKRWTGEMVLQDREPSQNTVRRLLLACASLGDVSGAEWWMRWLLKTGRPAGRLEFNAVIDTYGEEGLPRGARGWMERMEKAGLAPDARSYAAVIKSWEKVGNRKRMLEALRQMRDAESRGQLGKPLDPRDAASPYLAAARSYVDVADAPRAIAILKHLQAQGIPLSHEAHLLRLEAHLRTPGPRQSMKEIEHAFRDVIHHGPRGKDNKRMPVLNFELYQMCENTIGRSRFVDILEELGVEKQDVTASPRGESDMKDWDHAVLMRAIWSKETGRRVLMRKNEDAQWFETKLQGRQGAVMGEIETGYRMPLEDGSLPEWMTLTMPETYGY